MLGVKGFFPGPVLEDEAVEIEQDFDEQEFHLVPP